MNTITVRYPTEITWTLDADHQYVKQWLALTAEERDGFLKVLVHKFVTDTNRGGTWAKFDVHYKETANV